MERRWSVRAYREGDEQGIFELFKVVYPSRQYDWDRWIRWWQWMYQQNPCGAARIYLAEHGGKIVGHRSFIPMYLKVKDEIIKVIQGIDSMTHPDYRRQSMRSALLPQYLDDARRDGAQLDIGFANETSYAVGKKLGRFKIATMPLRFKLLNPENALKTRVSNRFLLKLVAIAASLAMKTAYRAQRTPAIEGLTISQVSSFDERIDELWNRVSSSHQIMVVRKKEYLNWRYAPPDVDYSIYLAEKAGEIHGYLVLRCTQQGEVKTGRIFDILGRSEAVIRCLVSQAVAHCQRGKANLVYCNLLANRTYHRALRNNGFMSAPFIKGASFRVISSSPSISEAFLKDPKNWFIQLGDSDEI